MRGIQKTAARETSNKAALFTSSVQYDKILSKFGQCEAKHAKQKLLNKAKLNTSVRQTLQEQRE